MMIPHSRRYFSLQYFYLLSEQGHLYHLFDPLPFIQKVSVPCGPAFLRNEKFLDFFFKNLHPTPPELPHAKLFPFVSRCGKEGNFLAVPGGFAPIVFTDSIAVNKNIQNENENVSTTPMKNNSRTLKFAGSLQQVLDPAQLREWEGRLYHPVPTERIIRGLQDGNAERSSLKAARRSSTIHQENEDGVVTTDKAASECVDPVL